MIERQHANIEDWIQSASANPIEYRRRQAVEVLIATISANSDLKHLLYLKGGMLMNLVYASPRMSGDVDFTTPASPEGFGQQITKTLNRAMDSAALDLGYTRLIFKVQRAEMRPPQPDFPWPTLQMTIGFANRGTSQEAMLAKGQSSGVLRVDISFNETVYNWDEVEVHVADTAPNDAAQQSSVIFAYSVHELVAEKLRAILQQKLRNRYRRQDIYDIARIVSTRVFADDDIDTIYRTLLAKCRSRNIEPTPDMIDDVELYERSRESYAEMELDRGGRPLDFDGDFSRVAHFYRSLPWAA